jgi:rSAM/selenodomain-associated transferase 1
MLKEPRPGRVKTRLGRDIGMGPAAWWFRHQARALIRNLRDPRWRLVLAVSPDRQGLTSRVWPADLPRLPQGRGDLGTRMAHVMRKAGSGPVCLVGADIPGLGKRQVFDAFAALGAHQAVFGPAADGGYWLVGLKHPRHAPSGWLAGVRWSTEHALSDSMATLRGLSVGMIEELPDVDTADDLQRVGQGRFCQ